MNGIELEAHAKINLHLDVVSKADNGYHGVNTVMQSISLCDIVSVFLCDDDTITITCDAEGLPCDRRNLAYRAAELFFERVEKRSGARVDIRKKIPMAAGLAGGSADAAAVFYALNKLFDEPLSRDELLSLGARLGADVPFCIAEGTKYADRFGDILHPFSPMSDCYIVVSCSGEGVSTPWAYAALDSKYSDFKAGAYDPRPISPLKNAMEKGSIKDIADNVYNIFESVIAPERPMVEEIKKILGDNGALASMMSGSGPSVFGIFETKDTADKAAAALSNSDIPAFVCQPVSERF